MTIVVNAVSAKLGGAVTDLRALVAELKNREPQHRYVFFVPPAQAHLGQGLPEHLQWRVSAAGEGGWPRRLWWDQVTLRRKLEQESADVLFSFSDFGLLACPVPQLLFVRNPLPFSDVFQEQLLPQRRWPARLVYWLRRWLVVRSIQAADTVMTPSATMLEMVRRAVPVPDSKARFNLYGAPAVKVGEASARSYEGDIRLVYPAAYYDHKNLGVALEALRLLRRSSGLRFRLVTTANPRSALARAQPTWESDLALLEELRADGAVEVLDFLPHDKLLELYNQCHVLCYPTLVESFGHPLVEALATGLPVVASDIPVNRELARDAALYFKPRDPADLAAQLREVVENAPLRAGLVERGHRYAREFSWAHHTQLLLGHLEELAQGKTASG